MMPVPNEPSERIDDVVSRLQEEIGLLLEATGIDSETNDAIMALIQNGEIRQAEGMYADNHGRGVCPGCRQVLRAGVDYRGARGYVIWWQCYSCGFRLEV